MSGDSKKTVSGNVIIEEVYPNPLGRDTKEFISLKNISSAPIDISGWNIKTEKSSGVFIFPPDSLIQSQKSFSLAQAQSTLRLQNTADAIYVFDSEGDVVDSVDYEDAPEDRILTKAKDGVWKWMKTSGANDKKKISKVQKTISRNTKKKNTARIIAYQYTEKESLSKTPIEKVRALELGESVKFRAVVSVEPGVLGKTLFYVAGSGIQIYSYRKDFPDIATGDIIDVSGILQESSDEMRVRITGKDAISIVSHGATPLPKTTETGDISEETEGYLVSLKGEVIEVRWPYVFVDDGSGEVRVYIKKSTGIEKRKLYAGDELSVTGIVSQTAAGYRVLPRYESDIVLIKNPEKEKTHQEETIPDRSKETQTVFQYLTAIGVTAVLVSLGLFIQYKMKE